MNYIKFFQLITLLVFTTIYSQTSPMVTTNIQSHLINKYWSSKQDDNSKVVLHFTQNDLSLFIGNIKISEQDSYYLTDYDEVKTTTTFSYSKVGRLSSGNHILTNRYVYIVEFFSDFQKFRIKKILDGEDKWQIYYLVNGTPYFNTEQSGTFTRNNCGDGNIGLESVYIVEAGKHISYVSQADADAKGIADVNTNGQNDVNGQNVCEYYNTETTRDVTKNNCPFGKVGSKVSFTVPARKYMSGISEEDVVKYVDADFNTAGQQYANSHCSCGFTNKWVSKYFTKQDCPSGKVTYDTTYCSVPEGKHFSTVSQATADDLALQDLNTNGPIRANTIGECAYESISVSGSFTKNNCIGTGVGSAVLYTVAAKQYKSRLSQEDANARAMSEVNEHGQGSANYKGTCTYSSTARSGFFAKNNCAIGSVASIVTYTVAAGKYTSTISQADADNKAQLDVNANGQAYANSIGFCTFKNTAKSVAFTKNNCATGGIASVVTYSVEAGKYTSIISQADADNKAQLDVNANGQVNANTKGTCLFKSKALSNVGFTKNNCIAPKVGSLVYYSAVAGAFTSYTSQADADAKAQKAGQDNANLKGTCN